jgi:peptidyl-prolyl cis-trans isomerase D
MAVIGYIRKHSAIAVILVGISLVAFLVGPNLIDWARNVLGYSTGPGTVREVGIINGKSISLAEFDGLSMKNVELTKINQQKADLTATEIYDIKNQTWDQKLNELIMNEEYDKLGLTISPDEMIDLLRGADPHRLIKQYFVGESGIYDPNLVVQYMQNIDQLPAQDRAQWENFKEFIYSDHLGSKYRTLLSKGFYYPSALAEMEYRNSSDGIGFRFVALNYINLADSLVPQPTDEDYRDEYEAVSNQYLESKSRDIEYVVFNILPSAEDLAMIEEETMEIYDEWINSRNPGEYVNNLPGNRYDSSWYARGELSVAIDSLMFASELGTFIEPYKDGSSWYMARLMDRQVRPDSANVEHVLIAYQGAFRSDPNMTRTKEEAEQLTDSIYNVLRADISKLPEIAIALSDDGSAAENAGNMGWFRDGQMVFAFNEASINGEEGDITMVETPFGYHVIHVKELTRAEERVRVAQIEIPIEYSSETYDRYYAQARQFAGENDTYEKFEQAVIDEGLEKREARFLREMQRELPGLENTRQVVRWVFWDEREVGDVSPLFDIGGKILVVAYTKGRDKGEVPFDEIKERLALQVINKEKAKYYDDKVTELGTDDIYVIAQSFGAKVDTVDNMTFATRNLIGYGTEHEVVGHLFALSEGTNSGVLYGNGAVFVVEMDKVFKAPPMEDYSSYSAQKTMNFESFILNNMDYRALMQNADITDYRRYFY